MMFNRASLCLAALLAAAVAHGQDHDPDKADYKVFQRVFGISRVVPAEILEQAKTLKPGERIELDNDGDGEVETIWYFDTDKRHTIQPLLVCAVDEDGDLAVNGRPDRDSDCYFWDHEADGYIDVVTDYVDDDGDNDVDQMGIFYDKNWKDDVDDLTVWWSMDIGDDNLLWYDVNGTYYQPLCQWRTHFSGDELFYQFRLTESDEKWVNVWEDPFAFYDPDGDRCSEMVIRISAIGDEVKNLRYSIDADDDAWGENTHNYDFSVTALPPEEGLVTTDWNGPALTIRGVETLPLLGWDKTAEFAQQAQWGSAMLTWDEINSNTDENPDQDPHERWEGVLNHASKHGDFEQVGGPPSSAFNKRVEVSHAPASPLRLQFEEADQRFHLVGAQQAYLDVDFDLDGTLDGAYTWSDTNSDGVLDLWECDVNGDGTVDISRRLNGKGKRYELVFEQIAPDYKKSIDTAQHTSQLFIDVASAVLSTLPEDVQKVLDFFTDGLQSYHPETELGESIRSSPAGARYYTELVRDRLFVALRTQFKSNQLWPQVASAFEAGEYERAAAVVATMSGLSLNRDLAERPLVLDGATYTRRICIEMEYEHPQAGPQLGRPYTIDVAALAGSDSTADFNPENCVVVDGDFRLAWRPVPHQIDDWAIGGNLQLTFLPEIPPTGKKKYYVYYGPGEREPGFPQLTRAVLDNPAYVAWESDAGAYRFYTGQFDFFGKHVSRDIPREERLLYPIVGENYHAEQTWGIDALHVGKTSGLGGLTLYVGDREYPVQSPAGEGHVTFEHVVLGAGPVRSAVAITAKGVLPEAPDEVVEIRCFAYARRPEAEIQVRFPLGLKDPSVGIGLMHLPEGSPFYNKELGVVGTWGYQGDEIGEIGLAAIAMTRFARSQTDSPIEQRLVCKLPTYDRADWERYHLRYWVVGDWRRGMQYAVSPTGENWQRRAERIAARLVAERNNMLIHEREIGK